MARDDVIAIFVEEMLGDAGELENEEKFERTWCWLAVRASNGSRKKDHPMPRRNKPASAGGRHVEKRAHLISFLPPFVCENAPATRWLTG